MWICIYCMKEERQLINCAKKKSERKTNEMEGEARNVAKKYQISIPNSNKPGFVVLCSTTTTKLRDNSRPGNKMWCKTPKRDISCKFLPSSNFRSLPTGPISNRIQESFSFARIAHRKKKGTIDLSRRSSFVLQTTFMFYSIKLYSSCSSRKEINSISIGFSS